MQREAKLLVEQLEALRGENKALPALRERVSELEVANAAKERWVWACFYSLR
jgi:hypothetical protein